MEDKTLLYIAVFVALFVYNLIKDNLKEAKKKKEAQLRKEAENPVFPDVSASYRDDAQYEEPADEEVPFEDEDSFDDDNVVSFDEVPHYHSELSHHHQERRSANAPERVTRDVHSDAFLTTEDELFSDTIAEVQIAEFDTNRIDGSDGTSSEYALKSAEEAKRAFVYAEIWNKKYC